MPRTLSRTEKLDLLLLALTPLVALIVVVLFVLIVALSRYVSLGSILAALAAIPAAYLLGYPQAAELYVALAALILLKHAGNIRRLIAGNENKLSFSK